MKNNIKLESEKLFNNSREPWYQWVKRKKDRDRLGYLKRNEDVFPIEIARNWDKNLQKSSLDDKNFPYDIFINIAFPSSLLFKEGFFIRLGTVFIYQSDEVDGNEQSLLENIMSEPEIQDRLEYVLNNLKY